MGRDVLAPLLHGDKAAISIHAPRMGRDCQSASGTYGVSDFNPRAPYGARQQRDRAQPRARDISIHAPRMGRDALTLHFIENVKISIHAPRMGRDQYDNFTNFATFNFNPRAPYGARPCA